MTLPTRPNLSTSTKAVQHYVERLEAALAESQRHLQVVARTMTGMQDQEPMVGFLRDDLNGGERVVPVLRQGETISFRPGGAEGRLRYDVTLPTGSAHLRIRTDSLYEERLAVMPEVSNVVNVALVRS